MTQTNVEIEAQSIEVFSRLRNRKDVFWGKVTPDIIREVVEKVAEEVGQTPRLLHGGDFCRQLEFVGGRTLEGLLNFFQRNPARLRRNTIDFMLDSVGIPDENVESVLQSMSRGHQVLWDRISSDVSRQIMQSAAEELGKPIAMLGRKDFNKHLILLNGHTIGGLYQHASRHPARGEQDALAFLFKRVGITMTAADVINYLSTPANNNSARKIANWGLLPPDEIQRLLVQVAAERGRPVSSLGASDFRYRLSLLGGHTLNGMFQHFYRHRERGEGSTFAFIMERAGFITSPQAVIERIKAGRIRWNNVPWEVIGEVLKMVATELGYPTAILSQTDLQKSIALLEGKTLAGLCTFARHREERKGSNLLSFILNKAGIQMSVDDLLVLPKSDRRILWERVPPQQIQAILRVVAEGMNMPVGALRRADLDQPLSQLSGQGLQSLYQYFRRHPNRQKKDVMVFMFEQVGINPQLEDLLYKIKDGAMIRWSRVSWDIIKQLIGKITQEVDQPIYTIGCAILAENYELLNGRSLGGLYAFCRTHKERGEKESVGGFIRRKCGLREPGSLTSFRFAMLREATESFFSEGDFSEDKVAPLAKIIARIYRSRGLGIEEDDLLSEVAIILLNNLRQAMIVSPNELLFVLHTQLEEIRRKVAFQRYKEISFQTGLRRPGFTFEHLLASPEIGSEERFNSELLSSFNKLSPIQKALLRGIFGENKTLEQTAESLGINSDTAQELYDEAIMTLREELL